MWIDTVPKALALLAAIFAALFVLSGFVGARGQEQFAIAVGVTAMVFGVLNYRRMNRR